MMIAAVTGPQPRLGQQLGEVSLDQHCEIGEELAFLAADLADPGEDRSGDAELRAARQPCELARERRADPRSDEACRP